MQRLILLLFLLFITVTGAPAYAQSRAAETVRKLMQPADGVIVIAHRGCHNPIPSLKMEGAAPENSLETLERCVALGVDVMETDVRRTRDGYLVMLHDDTVDRTTNAEGKVSDLTLEQLRRLRLRTGEGGQNAPLTDAQIPTLEEMLVRGRGRIVFNLDVKDAIYAEVIATVVRLGVSDQVLIKNSAGLGSPPLSEMEPYRQVPFMPILTSSDRTGSDLVSVARRQEESVHRPVAYEASHMDINYLSELSNEIKRQNVRLWVNTLFEGFVSGIGGDETALRNPDAVWGRLIDAGVTMIQTDYPDALLNYLHNRKAAP